MSAKKITTHQAIADQLGIRYDGEQDFVLKILSAFSITDGPAAGATFYLEGNVTLATVQDVVNQKVEGFSRG
jgi:hypothetical protein